VDLKFRGGCWGYILGCMAGIDVLGVLAPNQARSPNLAENEVICDFFRDSPTGPVLEGGERGGRPRPPNQEGPFPSIYKQYSIQNILAQVYTL
jgi:hypothetical protein